ncbi:MAG: Gfo/Idh/MocA family protein [Promethearchaeota archaeon]
MSKKWINIAVVGTGRIYEDAHRDAYINKASKNLMIIALCDMREDLVKKQFKWIKKKYEIRYKKAKKKGLEDQERFKFALDNLKTYTNYEKMLDDLEGTLDLVDNCTHGRGHIPLSVQAMEHGYHAMAEKPPGTNWWDVRRAVEAEKKTGKFFQLNENVCYERPTQKAREVIQEGHLGKIEEVSIAFGHGGPYIPYTFGKESYNIGGKIYKFKTKLPHFIDPIMAGGGCLQDLAPHGISKAFFPIFVKYPESRVLTCETKVLKRRKNPRIMSGKPFESPVDDWAEAILELHDPRTNSNYTMIVTTSWCGAPSAFPFSIEGEKGALTIVQNPNTKKYEPVIYPEDEDAEEKFFGINDDPWEPFKSHTREIQIFCDNILKGKPSNTPATYALALQEIISIQYFSKLMGKKVTIEDLDAFGENIAAKHENPQDAVDEISIKLTSAVDLT